MGKWKENRGIRLSSYKHAATSIPATEKATRNTADGLRDQVLEFAVSFADAKAATKGPAADYAGPS
jgi:hypothetical protein